MSYVYLASPYTRCPSLALAHAIVCKAAGEFVKAKIPVYSPIAHSHPIAMCAGIDPRAVDLWLPTNGPMIEAAASMAIVMTDGHDESQGIAWERRKFEAVQKPVFMVSEIPQPDELAVIGAYLASRAGVRMGDVA